MPVNADSPLDPHKRIEELERENTTLKIQILTITRDMANIIASISAGTLKHNGWGNDGKR